MAAPLKITLTAVSQHVRVLEHAGLVATRTSGRVRACQLDQTGFTLLEQWIQHHRAQWERRLDRLGALLQEDERIKRDAALVCHARHAWGCRGRWPPRAFA